MEKLVRITRHPLGGVGLAVGFAAGFVAAFMGEARRMLLFMSFLAIWQRIPYFRIRPELLPSSLKHKVDKGDHLHEAH